MALDPNRAALILQEYRYVIKEDDCVRAKFGQNVKEIALDTNLDQDGATALSNVLWPMVSSYARGFTITFQGLLFPEDFTVSPPRYVVTLSRYPAANGLVGNVVKASIDYFNNQTTVTVRG